MNLNNWMLEHYSMTRVLVTGFEPFANHSRNISGDLVNHLAEICSLVDPWKDIRNYELENIDLVIDKVILTVDQKGSVLTSEKLVAGERWDAIIHLGLCESCEQSRLEITAQNKLAMGIEDNSGRKVIEKTLGSKNLDSTVNNTLIFTNDLKSKAVISYDAGTFICNETYFNTLSQINFRLPKSDSKIPCIFIHLPDYDKFSIHEGTELLLEIIGRILFKPVISVAAGIFLSDEKILISRRDKGSSFAGHWEFAGGKFELGESASQAIEREIKEEFDWNVKSIEKFGNWFHSTDDYDIDLQVMICEFLDTIPELEDKRKWTSHDDPRWISNLQDVSPFVGIDGIVAKAVFESLSNPSGRFS